MSEPEHAGGIELATALATIERQAVEIDRLKRRLEDQRLAERLRDALQLAAAAGAIASPESHAALLERIVRTAAHVISARYGTLFLTDDERGELVFEIATAPDADQVRGMRIPAGHGIAGMVAVTGQPLAVADADRDPRQAADVARATGYTPRSLLCVPLLLDDRVIGVLELLDKTGSNAFDQHDIEALGLFAGQAAVAIEQSRAHRNLVALLAEVVAAPGRGEAYGRQGLLQQAREFAARVEADPAARQALDLARLVQEIAWRGERERAACAAILREFAAYLRTNP